MTELSTYVILGILLFTGAAIFSKGVISKLATVAGLMMAVFAYYIWF